VLGKLHLAIVRTQGAGFDCLLLRFWQAVGGSIVRRLPPGGSLGRHVISEVGFGIRRPAGLCLRIGRRCSLCGGGRKRLLSMLGILSGRLAASR
jgi:hypothetical protein